MLWVLVRHESPAATPTAEAQAPAAAVQLSVPDSRSAAQPLPLDGFFVDGRVVDLSGTPLPQIALGTVEDLQDPPRTARSDAQGRFALLVEDAPCEIEVIEPGWVTVRAGQAERDFAAMELIVVAARAATVEGLVVDPAGAPLGRANLVANLVLADEGEPLEFLAQSGADGRFAFAALPVAARIRLRTMLVDWITDEREFALPVDAALHIVLHPADSPGPLLEGEVQLPDGSPAAGALVALGAARAHSNAQGRFRLHCGWFAPETPLVALLRGFQPAIFAAYGAHIDPSARALPPERLQLPGPELAISGRLLDARGAPLKGWRVQLADATELDPGGTSPDAVEFELGARPELRTGGDGSFRFPGLSARSYVLLASGRERAARAEAALRSEPIPAGANNALLRLEPWDSGRNVRGTVLDPSGRPVEGARIGLGRAIVRHGTGEFVPQGRLRGSSDARGGFELSGVPSGVLFLVVTQAGCLPQRIELAPSARADGLVVRLASARVFRFDGSAAEPLPDRLRAFGAEGASQLWSLAGSAPWRTGSVLLREGRSLSFAVGPEAREIVLYRGPLELARLPAPAAGGEALMRWP